MKRRKHAEPESHERWLVSYADFITLLFALFAVLYATSQADNEKQAKFEQSFRKAVGMFQQGSGSNAGIMSEPFPSYIKDGTLIESQFKIFHVPNASRGEMKDALWQLVNTKLTEEQIREAGLDIRDDEHGLRITLAASQLFPPGSAKIVPSALKSLDVIGYILKKAERRLVVEGHTDDLKISSEQFPSNWELAAARASTIVRYLIKRNGLSSDMISVSSFADQKPVAPNNSEENRAKNRRIEILITTI